MTLHPKVSDALEQIDAAVFSGDSFMDERNKAALFYYMGRWLRELSPPVEPQDGGG